MLDINGINEIFNEVVREGGLLQRWFGKGRIIGKVSDSEGNPLTGVKVTLTDSKAPRIEETRFNGKFIFEKIRGKVEVSVEYNDVSIDNFDVLAINGGERRTIEYQLDLRFFSAPTTEPKSEVSPSSPVPEPKTPMEPSPKSESNALWDDLLSETRRTAAVQELFEELEYKQDDRTPPNAQRKARFLVGWRDAVAGDGDYSASTLARLTWSNLGYRLGKKFGQKSEEEIERVFELFAEHFSEANSVSPEFTSDESKALKERCKAIGSKEALGHFFHFLQEAIQTLEINEADPRLAATIPKSGNALPVSINRRYVLEIDGSIGALGFIHHPDYMTSLLKGHSIPPGEKLDEEALQDEDLMKLKICHVGRFSALKGESEEETPYYVRVEQDFVSNLPGEFTESWKKAITLEGGRGAKSPYRKFHKDVMFDVATDKDLRAKVLEEA